MRKEILRPRKDHYFSMEPSHPCRRVLPPILYFSDLALHLIAFRLFCGQRFSVDSYGAYMKGGYLFSSMVSNYRFTGAGIIRVMEWLERNPLIDDTLEIILYCIVASFVTAYLSWLLINRIHCRKVVEICCVNLSVLLTVLHVVMGSQMSFPECVTINTFGMLFCFFAIVVMERKQTIPYAIVSGLFLVLSVGTFQFYLELYLLYSFLFAMIRAVHDMNVQRKKAFYIGAKELGLPLVVFIVSLCIYFLVARLVLQKTSIRGTDRVGLNISNIIDNLKWYMINQHKYLRWTKYFSGEYMSICFGLLCALCCLVLWKAKRGGASREKLFMVLILSAFAYASMYVLPVISSVRSYRAMSGVMGVYLIGSVGILLFREHTRHAVKVLCVILGCAVALNVFAIIRHENNLIKTNEKDKIWASEILDQIHTYEQKNDMVVSKIAFCQDEQPTDSFYSYSYTGSAMTASWARKEIMNVYKASEHIRFTETDMDQQIYDSYFAGKNWDDPMIREQVVILEDTAYICCY